MATITITRDFTLQTDENPDLLSVYVPSTIEFEFDRGVISGSYAKVSINGYEFFATKIKTVGNIDTYKFFSSDIFKSLLSLPIGIFDDIITPLSLSCTVVCNGYNSAGSLIATANHKTFKLCLSISSAVNAGLSILETIGRTKTVYYSGNVISYFSVNDKKYKVKATTLTGLFTTDGCNFNIVRVGDVINFYILNSDGCFDYYNFTEIGTTYKSNKNNSILLFAENLDTWQANTYESIETIEEEKTFKIVAENAAHYEQMYFITKTPLILDENLGIWELSSPPSPLASCRQNLNFTFSLKRKANAQSY